MPQPAVVLSMLEAVQLFNGKPAGEWTAEELAAFRARMAQTPGLVATVGGQQAIERRLAEVEAALAEASARPAPVAVAADTTFTQIRKRFPLRRALEAAFFAVLIGTACFWLYRQLAEISGSSATHDSAAQGTESAGEALQPSGAESATPASQAATQPTGPDGDTAQADVPDGEQWQGWSVKSEGSGHSTFKRVWEVTLDGMEKRVESLILADGTVRLSQRRKLGPDERWLEIRARPKLPLLENQRLVVRVNGVDVDELDIGGGAVRWPAFVSLEKFAGQQVDLEVAYEAGGKGGQLICRSIVLTPQKRQVARRINCGGPLIESPDGDWEPDNSKARPYLVSLGSDAFTIKTPAPGTGELQEVYKDERWSYRFIAYDVPVEPGTYDVILHFAETNAGYQGVGKRQFDIILNGQTVAEKFDIFKQAGGAGALPFKQRIEVKEGPLQIRLQKNPAGPAIKGIEILKVR